LLYIFFNAFILNSKNNSMRMFLRTLMLPFVALVVCSLTAATTANGQATLNTDVADYAPGKTVTITGTGFQPLESVTVQVQHDDPSLRTADPVYDPWSVSADQNGDINTTWVNPSSQTVNTLLIVTAVGQSSGTSAFAYFTDNAVVVPAPGGTNISADNALNSTAPAGGAYTTLSGMSISEQLNTDFTPGSSLTLVLSAPTGWKFNPGAGTVNAQGGRNIVTSPPASGPQIAVTASTITVTFSVVGTDKSDNLTITNIQVKADDGANVPGTGNITRTGGSASIAGVPTGTNFGTLSQAAGAAKKLTFAQQPSNAVVATVISPAITVQIADQFGNAVTANPQRSITLSINNSGVLSGTNPITTVAGLATFNNISVTPAGTYNLTATVGGGGPALTSVVSNSFIISPPCTAPTFGTVTNLGPFNNTVGSCGTSVTLGGNVATSGTAPITLTYSLTNFGATIPSTSNFPVGTTTVWVKATNSCGNAVTSFTVTVTDNENPTITAPANVNANTNTNCTATGVSLGTPTTGDNCSVASVTNNHASTTYPLGTTTVTWTVTDGSGKTATATQLVTVTDNVNPTITAPANVNANTNTNCTATGVSLGTPTTGDNCSVASVTNNHASTTYPLGTTTVTWTVTDGSGNTATATQLVTVTDNVNPTITAPAATSGTTNVACTSTNVVLGTPVTGDNCSVASVTNDAPSAFPLGTTTVTWTVTDGSGNTATDEQIVTVTDNVNPTITAPAATSGTTNVACTSTNVVLGTPVTGDNCSVASVINDAPSAFPLGTTTVTWTVTDGSGNTATDEQIVTVTDNVNPTITAPAATSGTTNVACTSTNVVLGTPVNW
jgi:hypothetical protein